MAFGAKHRVRSQKNIDKRKVNRYLSDVSKSVNEGMVAFIENAKKVARIGKKASYVGMPQV